MFNWVFMVIRPVSWVDEAYVGMLTLCPSLGHV